MIGDLLRAYEAGRRARMDRHPLDWQPRHFRPQVREMYRLGWKDEDRRRARGYAQAELALHGARSDLHAAS